MNNLHENEQTAAFMKKLHVGFQDKRKRGTKG